MRDDFDAVVADRFKVLDDVAVPDTWSRVLDRVRVADTRLRVPVTEELVTMIDLETPVPTEPRQKDRMRVLVAGLLAAAAVVAIVLVATRDDDAVNPADEPSPTVTVTEPPAPSPRALPAGPLEPGTYFVDEIDGTPTPRIYFTIGAGWEGNASHLSPSISNAHWGGQYSSGGFMGFSRGLPSAVFSDACHWSDGYHPGPMDTVDSFVAALSEQRGWADVTGPSDISIDGYVGKALQRTAPADISDCNLSSAYGPRLAKPGKYPAFQSWEGGPHEPGSIETLWVLDIDGKVVVISTTLFPRDATVTVAAEGPSAADRAEFAAVLDSIRIDQG